LAHSGISFTAVQLRACRAKGFEHRELAVGWAVLAHNFWVLARREITAKRDREKQAKITSRRRPERPPNP